MEGGRGGREGGRGGEEKREKGIHSLVREEVFLFAATFIVTSMLLRVLLSRHAHWRLGRWSK